MSADLHTLTGAYATDALERVRPNARAFVRPAFDEPDQIVLRPASS